MSANKKKLILSSRLIIFSLLVVGLLLLVLGQFIEFKCIDDLLSALGQTLIGSSVVSFFLTFEDVQTLFMGTVKEIMVDNNNAKIFSKQQLEKMHTSCHDILHFQNMRINENDWKDLSNKCIEAFTSPYYSNWKETIICNLQDSIIEKNFSLDFELVNPLTNGETIANISRSYFLAIPEGMIKENYVQIKSLSIERDDESLVCTPCVEFSQIDTNVYNTKASIRCKEYDLENISFKRKLKVKVEHTTRVSKDDKSYTNRLRYAARQYLLDFTCNDNRVSLYPNFYGGFISLKDFVRDNKGNGHILIQCNEKFILPGSGASIVLNFNDIRKKNGTRRELLKSKQSSK